MKEITITVKKEYISKHHPYLSHKKCAITTALKEAGYSDLEDHGIDIINCTTREVVVSGDEYKKFVKKVLGMYMTAGLIKGCEDDKPYPLQDITITFKTQ